MSGCGCCNKNLIGGKKKPAKKPVVKKSVKKSKKGGSNVQPNDADVVNLSPLKGGYSFSTPNFMKEDVNKYYVFVYGRLINKSLEDPKLTGLFTNEIKRKLSFQSTNRTKKETSFKSDLMKSYIYGSYAILWNMTVKGENDEQKTFLKNKYSKHYEEAVKTNNSNELKNLLISFNDYYESKMKQNNSGINEETNIMNELKIYYLVNTYLLGAFKENPRIVNALESVKQEIHKYISSNKLNPIKYKLNQKINNVKKMQKVTVSPNGNGLFTGPKTSGNKRNATYRLNELGGGKKPVKKTTTKKPTTKKPVKKTTKKPTTKKPVKKTTTKKPITKKPVKKTTTKKTTTKKPVKKTTTKKPTTKKPVKKTTTKKPTSKKPVKKSVSKK